MKIGIKKMVEVEAKTLSVCAKCSDCFGANLLDQDGQIICDYDGYVPDIMPGEHYGDYIDLEIDLTTGNILNWKVPTKEDIERFIRIANKEEE